MEYTTIQNAPIDINFAELLNDRGWVLNGDIAIHQPCNSNTLLELITYNIIPNVNYDVTFKILEMNSSPQLKVGFGVPQFTYTTAQDVTVTLSTTSANQKLRLWGSGYIKLQLINIKKQISAETNLSENTIAYTELNNKWVSFRSYRPEKGFSMFSDFFTCSNGQLYIHRSGNIDNNFYNTQYQSSVKFPMSSVSVKNYHSIAIHSNELMVTTENGITTSLGQVSDLIATDFNSREGIHYANFLRDKLTDIINGDRLKGRYFVVELITTQGQKRLQLFKVIAKSSTSTNNE